MEKSTYPEKNGGSSGYSAQSGVSGYAVDKYESAPESAESGNVAEKYEKPLGSADKQTRDIRFNKGNLHSISAFYAK